MIADKTLIDKVESGVILTDLELKTALKFYTNLYVSLHLLGTKHSLSCNSIYRTVELLERFTEARKEK
jgi:hypothetical protein